MNPNYDFISNHHKFLLEQSQMINAFLSCRAPHLGLREKSIVQSRNALFSGGFRQKREFVHQLRRMMQS